MKEAFREKKFSAESQSRLEDVMRVIEKYEGMNITLTLRQLYYQLVAGGIIANQQKEYSKLSTLLTDARYCGLVDWDSIEDRIRKPQLPFVFDDVAELIDWSCKAYQTDFWLEQDYYVELYTEKDALSSVLAPIARRLRVPFNVNRGYSSASAMYDAAARFRDKEEKERVLLYLGDHDPSGLDMVRDIQARLNEFGAEVEVRHIALTTAQIQEYNPPPNPAKFSDPRASRYVAQHGRTSWEVDALPPEAMIKLVESEIRAYLDKDIVTRVLEKEHKDIEALKEFVKDYEGDTE